MLLSCGDGCSYAANFYIVEKYGQIRPMLRKLQLRCRYGDFKIRNIAVAIAFANRNLKLLFKGSLSLTVKQ